MIYKYENGGSKGSTEIISNPDVILVKKKNPIVGFVLFLISIILSALTLWIGFIIGFIFTLVKGKVGEYFLEMAIVIDQIGNVVMQHLLNLTLISSSGYLFGNKDETISSALGKNKKQGTLSNFGKWIDRILDSVDPNHTLNSIEYYVEGKNDIKTVKELDMLRSELVLKFPNVDFSSINLRPQNLVTM